MKEQKSVTARRIILTLTLAGFIAIPVTRLRAQSSESISSDEALSIRNPFSRGLARSLRTDQEGSGTTPRRFLGDHCHPGSASERATAAVLPRIRDPRTRRRAHWHRPQQTVGGIQHGTWAHTEGNEFAWTFVQDLFDGVGAFVGTLTVRVKLTLIGKDEFVGVSNGESRDAAGNLIFQPLRNSSRPAHHDRAAGATVSEHSVASIGAAKAGATGLFSDATGSFIVTRSFEFATGLTTGSFTGTVSSPGAGEP